MEYFNVSILASIAIGLMNSNCNKCNILIYSYALRLGGAERFSLTLLKHLDRDKFNITLALTKNEILFRDEIPMDIDLVIFNKNKSLFSIPCIVELIREKKIDIVFSTLSNPVICYLAISKNFLLRGVKFIAREPNMPSNTVSVDRFPLFRKILYKYMYPFLDKIVCLSPSMADDFHRNFGISNTKTTIIRNPIDIQKVQKLGNLTFSNFHGNRINLLAVGRLLTVQKGFDLLIKALSLLDEKYHLTIIGKGQDEIELKKLCHELGLNERITFEGFQSNPYVYMRNADILILSSRFEGSPNVVLEAMACGTPVVAFNCQGGHNEIISNGKNGFIAQNGDYFDLAKKIEHCATITFNKGEIRSYIEEKFSPENIINEYNNLFLSVGNNS